MDIHEKCRNHNNLQCDNMCYISNAGSVFRVQLSDIVNIFVIQKRERVAGINDLRAEQRQQLALEGGFPEMLLRKSGGISYVEMDLCI